jgi:hypothetical protein
LTGIDAPEIKGRSEEERAAAHSSQKALEDLILTPLHFYTFSHLKCPFYASSNS